MDKPRLQIVCSHGGFQETCLLCCTALEDKLNADSRQQRQRRLSSSIQLNGSRLIGRDMEPPMWGKPAIEAGSDAPEASFGLPILTRDPEDSPEHRTESSSTSIKKMRRKKKVSESHTLTVIDPSRQSQKLEPGKGELGAAQSSQEKETKALQSEPMLERILDAVKRMESAQQEQLQELGGLATKVGRIEDRVLSSGLPLPSRDAQVASAAVCKFTRLRKQAVASKARLARGSVSSADHGIGPCGTEHAENYERTNELGASAMQALMRSPTGHALGDFGQEYVKDTVATNPGKAHVLQQALNMRGSASHPLVNFVQKAQKATLLVKISVLAAGESVWRVPDACEMQAVQGKPDVQQGQHQIGSSSGRIKVEVINAEGLKDKDTVGYSDPYCICHAGPQGKPRASFQTAVKHNTSTPAWNHEHEFKSFQANESLQFTVKDKDRFSEDGHLGFVLLGFAQFYPAGFYGRMELLDDPDGEGEEIVNELDANLARQISKVSDLRGCVALAESTQSKIENRNLMAETFGKVQGMSPLQKDMSLDTGMTFLIVINCLVIGISMDYDHVAFVGIDAIFTLCYITEVYMKWRLIGYRKYFCSVGHTTDFLIICVDVAQLILSQFITSAADSAPPAAMFRVLRLVRLARIARLVQLEVFEDLVAMITGMVGGMKTLTWACGLFVGIVYITALMFREFFGRQSKVLDVEGNVDIMDYFDNVPRSMLTVYRLFFGDFSTTEGISLFEGIQLAYGSLAGVFVCVIFFIITVGVFNVIAAIFVERTVAAADTLSYEKKSVRLKDEKLWSEKITCLVRKLMEAHGMDFVKVNKPLSESLDEICAEPVTEEQFRMFIKEKEVIQALNDLEIDSADHEFLFDILDNDNTGAIYISQLVDGLRRLRGDPRRSDIITIDLMVRAIQEQTNMLIEGMESTLSRLTSVLDQTRPAGRPGEATSKKTRKVSGDSSVAPTSTSST